MKTSVTKMMMSLALMGCLIIGASDASAQGRSRSQGGSTSSRSQSTAVSRPSNQSTAPTVSRSSSTSSRTTSTSPQVNRSSSSSTRSMTTAPSSNSQVNRPSSTVTKPATTTKPSSTTTTTTRPSSTSRPSTGAVIRGGSSSGNSGNSGTPSTVTRRSDNIGSTVPKGTAVTSRERDVTTKDISTKKTTGSRPTEGSKPNGNLDKPTGNDRPSSGTTRPNGNSNVSGDKPNGKPNGGGNGNVGSDKPNGKPNGGHGNRPGYDNNNHFDYANHHYANDFHTNFNNHNWSRPLPPPVRPYRPTPLVWYRPVIPAGWYPYAGAPVIDRILGLTFGTLFDTSLDYLYYNGYEIDGYADHIIYLRNVPLLNLIWDDVMLSYDSLDRLVNAQFVFQSTYSSRNRYDRVYRNLCRVYGQPVARTSEGISWYGGNSTGWVTLSMHNNLGHYYTTVSIGY